jgi:hypothetical protein
MLGGRWEAQRAVTSAESLISADVSGAGTVTATAELLHHNFLCYHPSKITENRIILPSYNHFQCSPLLPDWLVMLSGYLCWTIDHF